MDSPPDIKIKLEEISIPAADQCEAIKSEPDLKLLIDELNKLSTQITKLDETISNIPEKTACLLSKELETKEKKIKKEDGSSIKGEPDAQEGDSTNKKIMDKKLAEGNGMNGIKRLIRGNWKFNDEFKFQAKFHDGKFCLKWNEETQFTHYILGKLDRGWTTTIKNNKISQEKYGDTFETRVFSFSSEGIKVEEYVGEETPKTYKYVSDVD